MSINSLSLFTLIKVQFPMIKAICFQTCSNFQMDIVHRYLLSTYLDSGMNFIYRTRVYTMYVRAVYRRKQQFIDQTLRTPYYHQSPALTKSTQQNKLISVRWNNFGLNFSKLYVLIQTTDKNYLKSSDRFLIPGILSFFKKSTFSRSRVLCSTYSYYSVW